jgi:CHAT domain-containing protein
MGASSADLLTGPGATEAALRREPLDQFRVLYFATHGLLPGELNCQAQPALALSPPATPATTKAEDGLLDAGEIAGLRLNADLVVLSACNTAESGTKFGGEALGGVAQAFFFAGASTLVASHWQVPSAATVALMVGMFQRLGTMPTAEALRQSQLALIARPATANPFHWAAFTVLGDGDRRGLAGPLSKQSRQSARLEDQVQ